MAERIASASEQLVAGVEESSVAAQEFTRLMEGATQEAASAGVNSEKMHEASTALSSAASSLDLIMDELIIKGTNAIQTTEESVGTMKSMIGWTKTRLPRTCSRPNALVSWRSNPSACGTRIHPGMDKLQ